MLYPGWIAWHSSRQMNDLSFQKSPDKSQISYFLLCNYIGLFIPVARLESDRLLKHAQSLQLAGDKSHTILPGAIRPMSTCSEGLTTRLQLPHWAERSDIYVHFYTTESWGGDDLYDFPPILYQVS